MKHKYLLFGLLALAACSQDKLPVPEENTPESLPETNVDGKYLATLPEFIVESAGETVLPQSRVAIDITKDDKGTYHTAYKWQNDDVIGIFPKPNAVADGETKPTEGDQVYFNVIPDPSKNNGRTATFDGGGWNVKKDYTYWAYCPFNRKDGFGQDKTKMPMDFTGQVWNKNNNYLSKRVYMLSEAKMTEGNFHFDFKALTCLGICNLHMPSNHQGYIKSLTFKMLDSAVQPFVETATFDITKAAGVGEGQDLPVDAITTTKTSSTFTLTAPTEEVNRFEFGSDASQLDKQWLFSQAALQGIAGKTCRVTVTFVSTKTETQGVETTYFTDFTFSKNWAPGHAYILDLSFPAIDLNKNSIQVDKPGSLRPSQVQAAMGTTNKLVVNGTLNANDFDVLRQAASAATQAASRAAGATVLTDLDLAGVEFDASMVTEGKVNFPFFNGTKLTRIVLPRKGANLNLQANTFNSVPLATFEWDLLGGVAYEGTIDPQAFEGCTTTECALKIGSSFFKSLSLDADNKMLFAGKEFKSYMKRTESPSGEVKDEELKAVTVDAASHTITTVIAGAMKDTDVTNALADGTDLTVVGPIKGDDFWWIRESAKNTIKTLNLSKAIIEAGVCADDHLIPNEESHNVPFKTEANALPMAAFKQSGLTSIALPENLEGIGNGAFFECGSLSTIQIPASVTKIENFAFASSGIKSIVIPEKVEALGNDVFNNCTSLTSVTFDNNSQITYLPDNFFFSCTVLQSFEFPATMKHIGFQAFAGTGLTNLVLPATITEIESKAFSSCHNLTTVTIQGDELKWDASQFPADAPDSSPFVPTATDDVFKLRDLIISEALSKQVTVNEKGELMFMGAPWKSIKDTTGKDIFDSVNPNPGINDWTPGEGGELEAE